MGRTSKHFHAWMNSQQAVYHLWLSRNVADESTYASSAVLTCYIDRTIRHITNFRNQEVISDAQLFIEGNNALASGITVKDKFVVDSAVRFVQKIHPYYDESGNLDYMVVYL